MFLRVRILCVALFFRNDGIILEISFRSCKKNDRPSRTKPSHMYDAELRETCLFFMSKEPKQKKVIEAVLDRHLSPNKLLLKTRYINSFEMIENRKRADKMWEA